MLPLSGWMLEMAKAVLMACHTCRYEELSDLSQKYKIRAVPLFMFWKGGEVVEQFATRERVRVAEAINKHAAYQVLEPK